MKQEAAKFIKDIKQIKNYWLGLKLPTDKTADGMLFSILSYIDGCAASSFGITLIDDQGIPINDEDMLHEFYYHVDEPEAHSQEEN